MVSTLTLKHVSESNWIPECIAADLLIPFIILYLKKKKSFKR